MTPVVLQKLASKAGFEYFIRVKLRGYSRIEREYQDRYKHNENVFFKRPSIIRQK